MFGNNPMRKAEHTGDGETLAVHSIFHTIQGEGPFAGRASTFVRLHGCHLACTFCDTDFESVNAKLRIDEIAQKCHAHKPSNLVVLTGGEPMRQNIVPLCTLLTSQGFVVQIETAGTYWLKGWEDGQGFGRVPNLVHIVVSPKTGQVHERIRAYAQAWKYLVSVTQMQFSDTDGLPLANTQIKDGKLHPLARPDHRLLRISPHRVCLQPMDEQDPVMLKMNTDMCVHLALKYGYSISLQQHKILGVE